MTRHNKNKTLHKKLHHRTINATYQSKRSLIVMLAILFMVCVHFFVLDVGDGIFKKGKFVPDEQIPVQQTADSEVIDVAPPSEEEAIVQTVKPARVEGGYIYPLFAEYYPYDPAAEDELKVKIPYIDGALKKPKPSYEYALQNPSSEKARIAIMIDDVGMNRTQSRAVVDITSVPLTLAFLPYAPDLESLTIPAMKAGHELMIHMPMEPMSSKVPLGPIAIMDSMSADEAKAMLEKAYASFDGYTGLNNHMGSRATQNKGVMAAVMDSLDAKGLFYVDSKTISTSVAADAAREQGLPHAERDIFLDHEETLEFARGALNKLEQVAVQKGHAIAIGHPKVNTVRALKEWLPTLEARGFEIVPVSELLLQPREKSAMTVASVDPVKSVVKKPAAKKQPKKKVQPSKAQDKKEKRVVSAPKFILDEPDVSGLDAPIIEPSSGLDVPNDPFIATEDLLSAPIGVADDFEGDISGGLYSLSE